MTNLQNVNAPDPALAERRSDSRLVFGLPLGAGGVLALLLLGGWVVPAAFRLNADQQRLNAMESKQRQLPLLRAQLQQTIAQQDQATDAERRLLGLIAGSGDLSTFMAQVGLEAQRHGVRLDELQPAAAAPPPDAKKAKTEAQKKAAEEAAAAQACGALGQSGFTAQRRSLVATGRYPNLLAFMRALENLSLLVVQCDLALQQPPPDTRPDPNAPAPPAPPMQVRFELSLFEKGKPAPAPAPGQPRASAQPPATAQPPAAAQP